jgi:hypothetical protein
VSQDGWEEVADYAIEWATKHATPVQRTERTPDAALSTKRRCSVRLNRCIISTTTTFIVGLPRKR